MVRDLIVDISVVISAITGIILVLFQLPITLSFFGWIPSVFSGWMGTVLIIFFGLYTLWHILNSLMSSESSEAAINEQLMHSLDSIEGCIEKHGVAWKGIADLRRGQIENIDVPYKPICPNCQTELIDKIEEPSLQERRQSPSYSPNAQPTEVFSCPNDNCGHTAAKEPRHHDEARSLFERDVKRITETVEEDYSLRTLVKKIEGEVTPQSIWEEYVDVVEDDHVSTNCFH